MPQAPVEFRWFPFQRLHDEVQREAPNAFSLLHASIGQLGGLRGTRRASCGCVPVKTRRLHAGGVIRYVCMGGWHV